MAELPTVAGLWIGGRLTWLERVSLKSFVDRGHRTILYTYGSVDGVPEGVEVHNGADIIDVAKMPTHNRTGSPALFSDLFRYHLMVQRPGEVWIDTDMYCWKPVDTPQQHIFGYETPGQLNGAILGLPADSEALGQMIEFTKDEYSIPDFLPRAFRRDYTARHEAGNPAHVSEMPWGVWGPLCVSHFLKKTGEAKYAASQDVYYPVHYKHRQDLFKRPMTVFRHLTDETRCIHLWARRVKRFAAKRNGGAAHPSSFFGWALREHKLDHNDGLIYASYREPFSKAEDIETKGARPTAHELGFAYEADKAAKKHMYTKVYDLLLRPFRDRKVNVLEMGLQWGGPEHGNEPDRKTSDVPSLRIWWNYFSKAHIYGLDISDFSWLEDDRFTFVQCDLDKREEIAAAADKMRELDVIIDDASNASKHQQDAFLEFFPKMKSGGLYIIEDLHQQTPLYEDQTPEITKTRDLFAGFLASGSFSHTDPDTRRAFDDLRSSISSCVLFPDRLIPGRQIKMAVIQKA